MGKIKRLTFIRNIDIKGFFTEFLLQNKQD